MSGTELNLFKLERAARYPVSPGHRGIETSIEAAEATAPKVGRLQRMTLAAITSACWNGLTADEASMTCGMDRWSIRPRLSELRVKGLIVDSGLRRPNVTGKRAIVWVVPTYKRSAAV